MGRHSARIMWVGFELVLVGITLPFVIALSATLPGVAPFFAIVGFLIVTAFGCVVTYVGANLDD
jgi:hypothetical protein